MRSQLNKTISSISASFEIVSENTVIATAERKNSVLFGGDVDFLCNNSLKYKLVCNQSGDFANLFKKPNERIENVYDIKNCKNEVIGHMAVREVKETFFKRYDYCELTLYDSIYNIYDIGLGKGKGYKYPIFQGDRQVALIEKDNIVYDNLDTYRVFALDEQSNEIACLYGLFLDTLCFAHRDEFGNVKFKGVRNTWDLSFNKTLVSKYDPNFISLNNL